ncbi:unnamed protein product (mitochondrion) [Plasmodiophora brassicae]|uniref:Uncharacterized protein n=1 Tax=Plasmodiophora brassicae TaxID=37360 RepID=A0A0G4IX45_PLABS|nr:hypothetical protein PBRA_007640 [Plasmodiophora brassicae]SPQ99537.1 unnamed protein product [Plasmodiophora brassicae]
MPRTKYDELLDRPKGGLEYNPEQTFALHVFWVVRSRRAAMEMVARGFRPCAAATERDTPTTLAYLFRVAHDQRLAERVRANVKTIGDHPHYSPAIRQMQMGIPRAAVELKLRQGGIDIGPLASSPDQAIDADALDFDPVVLECTEVYLDRRSFYEHAASRDWMKHSAEILQPARSLQATTHCVGAPGDVWDKALEGYLKAVRFDINPGPVVSAMRPGVFVGDDVAVGAPTVPWAFLEVDAGAEPQQWRVVRQEFDSLQTDLQARLMVVVPTSSPDDSESLSCPGARVMVSFALRDGVQTRAFSTIRNGCRTWLARLIVFGTGSVDAGRALLDRSDAAAAELVTVLDGDAARSEHILAGYPVHPLHHSLVSDPKFDYRL